MKMIFDFGNVVMDAARRQTCLADRHGVSGFSNLALYIVMDAARFELAAPRCFGEPEAQLAKRVLYRTELSARCKKERKCWCNQF